jgi:hypothetical protein
MPRDTSTSPRHRMKVLRDQYIRSTGSGGATPEGYTAHLGAYIRAHPEDVITDQVAYLIAPGIWRDGTEAERDEDDETADAHQLPLIGGIKLRRFFTIYDPELPGRTRTVHWEFATIQHHFEQIEISAAKWKQSGKKLRADRSQGKEMLKLAGGDRSKLLKDLTSPKSEDDGEGEPE